LAEGTTILRNAASEPHVQDLCRMLVAGLPIQGIAATRCVSKASQACAGPRSHQPELCRVGSYIGMGAITDGELRIVGVVPSTCA
jgi:UDP-N-acetylglucosamine 1-carboxyvinyltransferase